MRTAHGISFVADEVLAEGQDFMFISLQDGTSRIFYRESAITPKVLEDSWAAYRRLVDEDGGGPDDGAREPLARPLQLLPAPDRDVTSDGVFKLRRVI